MDRIEMEADRVNRLLDQLLDVARAEAEHGPLEPVDLRSLLIEVADQCEIEAAERGCEIVVEAPDGIGAIRGDGELLRRAVENIVRSPHLPRHEDPFVRRRRYECGVHQSAGSWPGSASRSPCRYIQTVLPGYWRVKWNGARGRPRARDCPARSGFAWRNDLSRELPAGIVRHHFPAAPVPELIHRLAIRAPPRSDV
jgi:hypothetical protein